MQRPLTLERTVGEALVLRQFALAVFGGAPPDAATLRAARRCAPQSWCVFLDIEACALPLLARLTARGELGSLGDDGHETLQQMAEAEAARVRAVGATIATLETVARRLGATAVLMKGAAHLAAGEEPLDLLDVDLLMGAEDAAALWTALRALDHRPADATGAGPVGDDGTNHLPRLVGPDGIPVEVHRRATYGANRYDTAGEVRPLPGFEALRRALGPATLRSTLWHAAHHHPHRYGRLRDVLLIAALHASITPDERRAAEPMLAASPTPEPGRMLALAQAVGRGTPIDDEPACRRMAARTYAMLLGEDAWMRRVAPMMEVLAFLGFERPRQRAARLAAYVLGGRTAASRWYSTRLAQVSPSLARVVEIACRTPPRAYVSAVAVAAAPRAVRRARRRLALATALVAGAEAVD